jgi:hypothetical protein
VPEDKSEGSQEYKEPLKGESNKAGRGKDILKQFQ